MIRRIDSYAYSNRLRHRHAAEKAVFSGGMLLLAIGVPTLAADLIVALTMLVATLGVARIPLKHYLPVVLLPLTFLLLGLPPFFLGLSWEQGLHFAFIPSSGLLALQVSLRMLASITCLLFLALTTPVPEILAVLRYCRFPAAVLEVALLTYRFLFAFYETAQTIFLAQSVRLGYRTFRKGLRSSGMLVASIFKQALERAKAMEIGLSARAWSGEFRVVPTEGNFSAPAIALIVVLQILLGSAMLLLGHFHV